MTNEIPLGELCHVDSGPAFKSAQFLEEGQGVRLLRGENIEPGALRWKKTKTWPETLSAEYAHLLVKPGDLILGMDRPVISSGLKLARVHASDCPALLVQRVARIRPHEIEGAYIYHWLSGPRFARYLQAAASGTQLPHITLKSIREFPVPRFGPQTERRIVETLEGHLSHLDAASSAITASNLHRGALIKSILVGQVPDADNYPDHWQRSTVADVGRVELGRQRHPDWHTGSNMKPYFRVANVFEDRIDSSDVMEMHWPGESFERFRLNEDEILLNEGQTPDLLGRPALYRGDPPDVAFTNSLIRFVAGPDVLPEFALLVFRRHMHAGRFKRESRITTNIAHLSVTRLKSVEFPVPPLEEQRRIVDTAQAQFSAVSALANQSEIIARRTDVLRRSVLSAAFEGRLTSRHEDSGLIEELATV